MSVRPIRLFGDPVLNSTASPITVFDDRLRRLVADMHETMRAAGGVGLAAPQVGVGKRLFVFAAGGMSGALINPTWCPIGAETSRAVEGCLSIPGLRAAVERPAAVLATGFDEAGRPVSLVASGLLARCIQHEADHLDGTLYLQRVDADTRRELMAQIRAADWFISQTTEQRIPQP